MLKFSIVNMLKGLKTYERLNLGGTIDVSFDNFTTLLLTDCILLHSLSTTVLYHYDIVLSLH